MCFLLRCLPRWGSLRPSFQKNRESLSCASSRQLQWLSCWCFNLGRVSVNTIWLKAAHFLLHLCLFFQPWCTIQVIPIYYLLISFFWQPSKWWQPTSMLQQQTEVLSKEMNRSMTIFWLVEIKTGLCSFFQKCIWHLNLINHGNGSMVGMHI